MSAMTPQEEEVRSMMRHRAAMYEATREAARSGSADNAQSGSKARVPLKSILKKKNLVRRDPEDDGLNEVRVDGSTSSIDQEISDGLSREEPRGAERGNVLPVARVPPQPPRVDSSRPIRPTVHRAEQPSGASHESQIPAIRTPRFENLPRAEETSWFDFLLKFMHQFRDHRENPVWYRVCILLLGSALVIGVFTLAGAASLHLLGSPQVVQSSVGAAALLRKNLWSILNKTLLNQDHVDEIGISPVDITTPINVIGKQDQDVNVKVVDISKFEPQDFSEFFLCHDPRDRSCVVFPALSPSSRFVSVVPLEEKPKLVGDYEKRLFEKMCEASKTFKSIVS